MKPEDINRCFMRFTHRAERITSEQVAETFVSVGPVMDLLDSSNNQIMFGRRGTGKTHALRYFQTLRKKRGDIAIYIDCQSIGSNGSIYNDNSLPLGERATRLLIDICAGIHYELLEVFTASDSSWNLADAAPLLDRFADGFSEVRIVGVRESESGEAATSTGKSGFSLGATASSLQASAMSESSTSTTHNSKDAVKGTEESWLDFGFFSRTIRELASFIGAKRLWILIDEWTTIPSDLQPYVADLLRRSMFNVSNITVKIAAIEHRSNFKTDRPDEGYIGLELGADIGATINLDDYLVVEKNEERAKAFFRNFVASHTISVAHELGLTIEKSKITQSAFTQENVFTEFVRSTEGVPRDAMHILATAAQRAVAQPISMPIIRYAASSFFKTEKYTAIQSNEENRALLDWIRDEVIQERRTRAFLLPVGATDPIIDRLFDRRALHILNRNRSAAHRPGERFVVYKLDYGLYVDLMNTDSFPTALLSEDLDAEADSATAAHDYEVPVDDARSYRRAILELARFYDKHPQYAGDRR